MKKSEISRFIERYLSHRDAGKDIYFDADEIDDLLEEFEASDDYTYYDEILNLGLRLHPENISLQIRKCHSLFFYEKYEETLALIDSIGETDDPELLSLRLQSYCMLHRYEQADALIDRLTAENNEYLEEIFEELVEVLNDFGMYKEAHDFINRGIRLFPKNKNLKEELCFVLEMEGEVDTAIKNCNELIDKDPYSFESWYTLGHLYSVQDEYEKAAEAFDFALTCGTSDDKELQDEIRELKAYNLSMNKHYEKAIETYREIRMDDPEIEARILPLIAECYIHMKQISKAYTLLNSLLIRHGKFNDAGTYLHYLRCCIELGKTEEEEKILFQASGLFPDNIRILSLLALNRIENQEEEAAARLIEQLFKKLENIENKTPENIEYLYQAALFLQMKGELKKALEYYKMVLEARPNIPFINIYMAMLYLEMGDIQHFEEHIEKLTLKDLALFLKDNDLPTEQLPERPNSKPISAKDLAKEFLKNKDNSN